MNKLLVLALALGTLFGGCAEAGEYGTESEDRAILQHLKTVLWNQAYRTQDAQLLDQILHESFQVLDADGNRSSKVEEMAYISENRWDPGEFEYHIERLEIFQGRFAVIDGTGEASNYRYKSSNFLIKEDGRWQAIASHVSGYQEKP